MNCRIVIVGRDIVGDIGSQLMVDQPSVGQYHCWSIRLLVARYCWPMSPLAIPLLLLLPKLLPLIIVVGSNTVALINTSCLMLIVGPKHY